MDKNKYPLSMKQIQALKECNARINILEGSVRSGKSFIAMLIFLNQVRFGPTGEYIIVGKSERTVLHNVIEPLNHLLGGIIRYNRGLGEFTLFEKKVYVVGANDERAEGKIRGSTFAGALVDEVSIIPEGFFKMLLSRLSIKGAQLVGTTNPDSPYHWLKSEFIDNPDLDIKSFQFRLEDNPSLDEKFVASLKKEYRGLWYKRFILGQWVLAEGAIYDFFEEALYVRKEPPTYAKYYILGIDYGTTNPFAAVLIGVNDDHRPSLWVEKEYYWDSKKMGYQRTDSEYCLDIKREFGAYPIKMIYLDPAAASFEVELRRAKLPVQQAKNEVIDGIRFVASLFTNGDLIIIDRCFHLIKEIEGYIWDIKSARDGVDRPLKQRDHAVDALRYALFTFGGHKMNIQVQTKQPKPINPMNYQGYGPNSWGWSKI